MLPRTQYLNNNKLVLDYSDKTAGRRLTFKPQNGKKMFSRNTLEACLHCGKTRDPGGKPLQLCGGCRSTHFCSKEHQILAWKEHKGLCKRTQENNRLYAAMETVTESSSTSTPGPGEIKLMMEDWVEVHRRTWEGAMASAIHIMDPPFNFKKQWVHCALEYRPESNGNPSTCFKLKEVAFKHDVPGMGFEVFRETVERGGLDPRALGGLICLYECDWIAWRDVTILFKEDLLRRTLVPDAPIDHNDWFSRLKGIVEKGAVSRNIAVPGNVTYVMGAISPNERLASGDWIWKPYQPNEVLALGISI